MKAGGQVQRWGLVMQPHAVDGCSLTGLPLEPDMFLVS